MLTILVCVVLLAGLFWSRVTISTMSLAIGAALLVVNYIWKTTKVVVIGALMFLVAALALYFVHTH
jgi:hypothetical protein